ncbi:MAG: lipopolysaccharide biosynthesis protein [Odoribacter sp.]|nr:lipopolysaccharide biosynthesis protein [Odoribacter sp.]
MAESLKNKTIKGSFWSFTDSILGSGITFVVGLVLARILTPHEYGLIGIISIFISIFNSIVDSGFSNALIRKNDASDVDYDTVFLFNLLLSLFIFCGFYLLAPFVGEFFNEPQLVLLCRVMAIIIIINAFAIIQRTLFVKKVDFKTQTKVSLIASISSGFIGVCMALMNFGVWSLVGQQISRQFLNTLFLWIYGHWKPQFQFSISSFNELFGFGWKLLVSSLINTIWNEIYQIVIGKFYTSSVLGQYTRAQQFALLPSSNLTSVIQRVTYPVLSSIQNDVERLKQAYCRVIRVSTLITFVLMLGLAATAESLVLVLVGEQWLPSVKFLQIICFSYMLYPLHALNLNMLQVQGRSDLFLRLEIIKKIIALGPILLGVFIDIYWMLVGSIFTGFFAYYLNAYYSGPFLKYGIWQQVKDILPSLGVALTMALIVYGIGCFPWSPFLLLPLQIFAGAVITIFLCHFFKLEEYIELKNIVLSYIKKR